jgi:hypothetical protein
MPLNKYFKGSGEKVMHAMQKEYGDTKGKKVFYATANKQGMSVGPSKSVRKKHGV